MPEALKNTETKNVLLVGAAGKTGVSLLEFLLRKNFRVFAFDAQENYLMPDFATPYLKKGLAIDVSKADFESGSILEQVDFLTLSPGVPLNIQIFVMAKSRGIPILSEVELCAKELQDFKMIGVTGTDGKSTTTALITHLLNHLSMKTVSPQNHSKPIAISCGNFGFPFSGVANQKYKNSEEWANAKWLVAELSSYQLELFRNVPLFCGVFLNLAEDHLDRYDTMAQYGRAKFNIINGLSSDASLIIDANLLPQNTDLFDHKTGHPLTYRLRDFSITAIDGQKLDDKSSPNDFMVAKDGFITFRNKAIVHKDELLLKGDHNLSNVLFALTAVYKVFSSLEADYKLLESQWQKALCSFEPLPHRFEVIVSQDGNTYINDSKATTCQALRCSLQNAKPPVFLFMGGRSKGEDYSLIESVILEKQANAFVYGENSTEIMKSCSHAPMHGPFLGLEEAFFAAKKFQKDKKIEHATYLLSPASTSWDQYQSFEHRGRHFIDLVHGVEGKNR